MKKSWLFALPVSKNFIIFFLNVSPEKPFIEMKEPWLKVWEVTVGDQTPTVIPVKYSAYPEPSFKWYVHITMEQEFHFILFKWSWGEYD